MRPFRHLKDIVSLKSEKTIENFVMYFLIKWIMCTDCRKLGNFYLKKLKETKFTQNPLPIITVNIMVCVCPYVCNAYLYVFLNEKVWYFNFLQPPFLKI